MDSESAVFQPSTVRGSADAPRGALQFHVERNFDGSPVGHPMIWVLAKRKTPRVFGAPCKCTEVYELVLRMLPKNRRKRMRDLMQKNGTNRMTVCDCRGRIIE